MLKEIKLHDKVFIPFISSEEIELAIDQVAEKINEDYRDSDVIPVVLCVLNGAMMFTSDLLKRLEFNCELMSMKLSSYVGTSSTGDVLTKMNITGDVKNREVIVVEDIVDTGNTIEKLISILKEAGASSVKICTMLHKPEIYQKSIKLDYVAKNIPNAFIVGRGLDYDELGRNYKDIYVISDK